MTQELLHKYFKGNTTVDNNLLNKSSNLQMNNLK